MSTPNLILIKRRLSNSILGLSPLPLTGGELGFNEVNNTLYYGSSSGVIDIAGPGSYTRLSLTNNLTGILQNQINNLTLGTSTELQTVSSNLFTTINTVSGNLNTTISTVSGNLNTTISTVSGNIVTYTNSSFLPLSGGTVTGKVYLHDNLTVYGTISATGNSYFANTIYSTTSALSVINIGNNGPALYVSNNGTGDLASFYDYDTNVEMLHVGGFNGDYPNVGVKTSTPNVDFTVNGSISSSNIIYGDNLIINNLLSANSLSLSNNNITTDINGNLTVNGTIFGSGYNYISNFIIDGGVI